MAGHVLATLQAPKTTSQWIARRGFTEVAESSTWPDHDHMPRSSPIPLHNTSTPSEESIMDTLDDQATRNRRSPPITTRDHQTVLDAIADDVGMAMRDIGLRFPSTSQCATRETRWRRSRRRSIRRPGLAARIGDVCQIIAKRIGSGDCPELNACELRTRCR